MESSDWPFPRRRRSARRAGSRGNRVNTTLLNGCHSILVGPEADQPSCRDRVRQAHVPQRHMMLRERRDPAHADARRALLASLRRYSAAGDPTEPTKS